MAKEKTTAAEPEAAKQAPVKSAGQETSYRIEEFAEAAELMFNTRPAIVRAALKAGGKESYTKKEAQELVGAITSKEV